MIEEFLAEMKRFVPDNARVMSCQFRGDPNADMRGKWRAKVMNCVELIDEGANVYFCVSAMKQNARGEWRRRKDNFAGGILLMIDDIGTGKGAKFPMSVIDPLPPTALIETSPDNYQAMYFFDSLVTDEKEFDGLIRAFIQKEFLGKDTGQAGVNRVFRPPAGVNGKPKYGGWKVRCTSWHPDRRYSVQQIVDAFSLTLQKPVRPPRVEVGERKEKIAVFTHIARTLDSCGMLKNREPDQGGWMEITCPFVDGHSDRADTGAAIRIPDEENGFTGAFRCHHGSCEGRSWRDLTQWLQDEEAEILQLINSTAENYEFYRLRRDDETPSGTGRRAEQQAVKNNGGLPLR